MGLDMCAYMENTTLINEIIKDIRLTTNNTPWQYYYKKLLKGIRW